MNLDEFEDILSKGKCKPVLLKFDTTKHKDRRKYFRINFHQLLVASATIKELNGKPISIGDTKVLIQDIGPGGLCFISNLNLPIEKNIIMRFATQLIGEEINVLGRLIWSEEIDTNLYEYGIEFTIDEDVREDLVRIFNTVQIKMRKDILFAEGDFITTSPQSFFSTP